MAINALCKMGITKYRKMALEDWFSPRRRFPGATEVPKDISEEQELMLARGIDFGEFHLAYNAANKVRKVASRPSIVPILQKALERHRNNGPIQTMILESWEKVDPQGAERWRLDWEEPEQRVFPKTEAQRIEEALEKIRDRQNRKGTDN